MSAGAAGGSHTPHAGQGLVCGERVGVGTPRGRLFLDVRKDPSEQLPNPAKIDDRIQQAEAGDPAIRAVERGKPVGGSRRTSARCICRRASTKRSSRSLAHSAMTSSASCPARSPKFSQFGEEAGLEIGS